MMLLAALVLRALGFLISVIDTDEGLYLVQAQAWLRGGWPLVAVWDMHPIGAPAMFAGAMAVLGESIATIRLLGAFCVAAAATALYGAVRAAGAPRGIAVAAGLVYVGHTLRMGGLATNTEILFAPMVVTAMALGVRGMTRTLHLGQPPGWYPLIAMGAAMGWALSVKPVVAPEGCLAFALLVFPALWRRVLPWRRALAMAAVYAGFCALPTVFFGLLYLLRGDFSAFLDGSFLAPFRYAEGRLEPGGIHPPHPGGGAGCCSGPCPGRAGAGCAGLAGQGRAVCWPGSALVWFAVGSIGVAAPGLLLPALFPDLAAIPGDPGGARLLAAGALLARPRGGPAASACWSWWWWWGPGGQDATARIGRGIGILAPDPVQQIAEGDPARDAAGRKPSSSPITIRSSTR